MNKTSLLELARKFKIPLRNCLKTKEELDEAIRDTIKKYNEIIFGADTLVCMTSLNKLRKQYVIDKKVFDPKLMDDAVRKLAWGALQKHIVIDGNRMIEKRTGEVLDPEVNLTYWKEKF